MRKQELEERLVALEQKMAYEQRHGKTQPAPESKPKPRRQLRLHVKMPTLLKTHKWVILSVAGASLLLVTSLLFFTQTRQPATQASQLQQVASSATFEIYVPSKDLPQGFTFNEKSISISSGIVIYTIAGPNNSTITVTSQKKPNNFDYQRIQTDTSFKTPHGTATAYEQSDRSMGSLVSDSTWVVLNSSKAIGTKAMEAVLQSLQTAK